MILISIR